MDNHMIIGDAQHPPSCKPRERKGSRFGLQINDSDNSKSDAGYETPRGDLSQESVSIFDLTAMLANCVRSGYGLQFASRKWITLLICENDSKNQWPHLGRPLEKMKSSR